MINCSMEKITLDQVDEILGEDKNLCLCKIQDQDVDKFIYQHFDC